MLFYNSNIVINYLRISYNVFWSYLLRSFSYISPFHHLSIFTSPPPSMQPSVFFSLPLSPVPVTQLLLGVGPALERGHITEGHVIKESESPSHKLSNTNGSFSAAGGSSFPPRHLCAGILSGLSLSRYCSSMLSQSP